MLRKIRFNLLYFGKPRWDTGISPPELLEFIASQPPGRALDVGCGTGTNAITLAQHGWQVTGVDFVGAAVRIAKRKAKQAGVKVDFYTEDVTRLDGLTEPFNLILDIGCFHSLPPDAKPAYIENVHRLLAPQGTFLLYGFLNASANAHLPGHTRQDLELLMSVLRLSWRKDGVDHHQRPSAWFSFTTRGEAA